MTRNAMLGEFLRELGVLWVAFSILDSALSDHGADWSIALAFFSAGLFCLVGGVYLTERSE